jgi:hypothetical protein
MANEELHGLALWLRLILNHDVGDTISEALFMDHTRVVKAMQPLTAIGRGFDNLRVAHQQGWIIFGYP